MGLLLLLTLGLIAGTVGGIVGFGSSVMLMPALVIMYGPRTAVPIMAVTALMTNLARVIAWWREVDWRACAVYSVTAVPAAALGARTLVTIPPRLADGVLGLFFVFMVPARRWMADKGLRVGLGHLALAGAAIGYATGIVVSTGPINTPFFLAYGLAKGAFLGTEALGSLGMYVSKAVAFRSFGALPNETVLQGLVIGTSMMAGSFLAKRLVVRLPAERFYLLMDAVLLVSGLTMLGAAFF
ncbi:MAG TPA: sulfite exporter TauE/SafE family protein [Burkholderiales bacterium]|nr:sulfite exporter TauE/SafE family protein [Burkholderiales bacterium]